MRLNEGFNRKSQVQNNVYTACKVTQILHLQCETPKRHLHMNGRYGHWRRYSHFQLPSLGETSAYFQFIILPCWPVIFNWWPVASRSRQCSQQLRHQKPAGKNFGKADWDSSKLSTFFSEMGCGSPCQECLCEQYVWRLCLGDRHGS